MSYWFELILKGSELEDKCSLLFDYGIQGAVFNIEGTALCYLQSENPELSDALSQVVSQLDLEIVKCSSLPEVNWTQACPELLEPLRIDKLTVLPVQDQNQAAIKFSGAENEILIIPGTGFGTGHHASTKNILKLLQSDLIAKLSPKTVLDAGSGSGILAIAACKLFACQTDAYEVDSLACENAESNIKINHLDDRIKLFCESADRAQAKYDLVIANLYAELLDSMCEPLVGRLSSSGCLLLSGIRADLAAEIRAKYENHALKCESQVTEDNWTTMMFSAVRPLKD